MAAKKTAPAKAAPKSAPAPKPKPRAKAEAEVEIEEEIEVEDAPKSRKKTDIEIVSPAIHVAHKSGRGKIPAYFSSPEFLAMARRMDKVEDKVKCQAVYMQESGYVKYPISTGILAYDLKLGGGLAGGRVHVEYGGERSGKSSRCTTLLGTCVIDEVLPFFFDAETALDASYMDRILRNSVGLTLKQLQGSIDANGEWVEPPLVRYYRENMGRKFFSLVHEMLNALPDIEQDRNGQFWRVTSNGKAAPTYEECSGYPQALFLEDSVAALNPSIKGDVMDESNTMAPHARLLSWGFPLVKGLLGQKNATLFMTNQIRQKPGVTMGSPDYCPGGPTFLHNNDMRAKTESRHPKSEEFEIAKLGFVCKTGDNFSTERSLDGGVDKHHYQRIRIEKNKSYVSNKRVLMRTIYERNGKPGHGICETYDLYQFLKATGQVTLRAGKLTLKVEGTKPTGKIPDLLGANGETLSWMKLKEMVEDRKTYKECLRLHCARQMQSGYAFELEAKAAKLTGGTDDMHDEAGNDDED